VTAREMHTGEEMWAEMTRLAVSELRGELSEALGRVAYGNERLIVQRKGKDFAAVVSIEDLKLLEELEDLGLIALADEAEEKSTRRVSHDEVKARYGL
jgi:prevent-host-death family protein